jgi:dynein heavy chain, axonemal
MHTLDLNNSEQLVWSEVDGESPPPRSRHSCVVVKHYLVVFGGLNHRARYDDVWIHDTKKNAWHELKCGGAAEDRPSPRAHHTATIVGNQMFVFGGYSGHGKSSNELFVLDFGTVFEEIETPDDVDIPTPATWSKPVLNGNGPTARFDHGASWFPNKLVVLGGRDNISMFNDTHFLDLDTMTWVEEGTSAPSPYTMEISNHQLSAIESVPKYKMFCLTGKKGQNEYMNHVDVMDCGTLVWNTPKAIGSPPVVREDTAMAYDPKTCKVILFGGWSNRWLGDTWTLNVSPIIGPPYACSKVVPDIGPVFGESEIVIHGLQFKESDKIEVSFRSGKNEEIAPGHFVDEHTLTCQTPNFEDFGALEVDLRVNINDEGWTVNKLKFRYFANTSAENCIAYGPGVNADVEGVFGVEIPFFICAKDTCNAKRTSGDDEFIIEVTNARGVLHSAHAGTLSHRRWLRRPRRAPGDYPHPRFSLLHELWRSLDVSAHVGSRAAQAQARRAHVSRTSAGVPVRRRR